MAYKCIIPEGSQKGWCVEKVTEVVPLRKMTTEFPEDSWGMSKMFGNFATELHLEAKGESQTALHMLTYYQPIGLKVRLLNIILMRAMMRKRAKKTLLGLKTLVEKNA